MGTDHRKLWRNNQDSYYIHKSLNALIGVVSDGCGSVENSEAGAVLLPRLLAVSIQSRIASSNSWAMENLMRSPLVTSTFLESCLEDIRDKLLHIARYQHSVLVPMTATLVGFLVTKYGAAVFSLGDGVIGDAKWYALLECGNEPPYLIHATGLAGTEKANNTHFITHYTFTPATVGISAIMVGTDGLAELIGKVGCQIPGTCQAIPSFGHSCGMPWPYENSASLQRMLNRIQGVAKNREGLLRDDTTVIMARKLPDHVLSDGESKEE